MKYPSIIYKIDLNTNNKVVFLEKPFIYYLKLSPNNNFMSMIYRKTEKIEPIGILIINKNNKQDLVYIEDNILEYKWSPDSKKIIYITGEYISNDHSYDKIDGVWVYNIESKKKTKIADEAYNVEWFQNDLIYLINTWSPEERHPYIVNKTRIYNYQTGKIEQNDMNGLSFSLDGKYIMKLSDEIIDLDFTDDNANKKILRDICELKTNKCISRDKLVNTFESPEYISWEDVMWAANNRIIIPRRTPGKKSISIYDIRNDMFLKREYGTLVGTNYKRDKLVMYTLDKKFIIVDVP